MQYSQLKFDNAMDISFNGSRFGKLISNEFHVNFKKMAIMLGIMLVLPVVYFTLMSVMGSRADFQSTSLIFFLVILIFQGYITNICFSEFSTKPRTSSFLLVPASGLEKYMVKCLYCIIIFPLIFLIYHYLVVKFSLIYNTDSGSFDLQRWNAGKENKEVLLSMLSTWFLAATAYFCGAQFFKKRSETKTFLIGMAILILSMILTPLFYFLVSGHWPSGNFPFMYIAERIMVNEERRTLTHFFLETDNYMQHWFTLFVSLYFMVISWFKFNEKTV